MKQQGRGIAITQKFEKEKVNSPFNRRRSRNKIKSVFYQEEDIEKLHAFSTAKKTGKQVYVVDNLKFTFTREAFFF